MRAERALAMLEPLEPIAAGDCLDVLFTVMLGEWNGSPYAELRLRDTRGHRPD